VARQKRNNKWEPRLDEMVRTAPTETRGAMTGRIVALRPDGLGVDVRDEWSGGVYPIRTEDLRPPKGR